MGHEDVTTTLGIYADTPADYLDRVDAVFGQGERTDVVSLEERFRQHVMAEVKRLQGRYNPTEFLRMVHEHGAVGATKRLLVDPRSTSYGFGRLWDLGALDASVEFAVRLPWFQLLFTPDEIEKAEQRLVAHDFPLGERLGQATRTPPSWLVDDSLPDESDE